MAFATTMMAQQEVAPPVFSVKGGIYTKVEGLYFTSETPDAKVLYCKDGRNPIDEGQRLYGSSKETVLSTTTINAVAYIKDAKGKEIFSEITSEHYVISPLSLFRLAGELNDSCYLINCGNKVATPILLPNDTGIFTPKEATFLNEEHIEINAFYGFGINVTEGGYTIQDAYGRYMYLTDDNSFHFASEKPAEGAVWNIELDKDTYSAVISNVKSGKLIAYNTQEELFSVYAESELTDSHIFPNLFAKIEYPTITVTPADGEEITEFSKFTVYCESGIEYSIFGEAGSETYAYYSVGTDSKKNGFPTTTVIDENTIEFSLRKPLTSNNEYKVVFPAGVFTINPGGLNQKNEEIKLNYVLNNVNNLTVDYANPANKGSVKNLQSLYFEFNQDISISAEGAYITDAAGKQYPLTVSDIDSWGEACGANALCLKADSILPAGEYTFVLKTTYVSAKDNSSVKLSKDITYNIISTEGLKVNSTTPANEATCESVSSIVVEFNKAAMHDQFIELIVTDADGKEFIFTKEEDSASEANSLTFIAQEAITAAGTYTFTIYSYDVYLEDPNSLDGMEYIQESTFTFTVDQTSGIENVTTENGKANIIYDLTGRRVNEITKAGIYIVNGKKILVK